MEIEFLWLLSYLLLGAFIGFMAGLLGIGGGGFMVPILTFLFLLQDVPVDKVLHLALGTAMASIIVTSLSSLLAHHRKQGVIWSVWRQVTPGIIIGTFLATFIASSLSSIPLAIFFSVFMVYVSLQMFINKSPNANRKLPSPFFVTVAGSIIGSVSAMVSIGGGSLTVPYLIWHSIDLKKAIGTSAAVGFPIAIMGTLGYLINGLSQPLNLPHTLGFINLPAVIGISIVSFFTAPLGVQLAYRLPVQKLKKIFALVLFLLSIKMLVLVIVS